MLTQHLSQAEQLILVKVIDALGQINSVNEFCSCLDGIFQEVLPHECMACGIVQISQDGIRPKHMVLNHFPSAYLAYIHQSNGSLCSPALAYWCLHREPLVINLEDPEKYLPESVLSLAREFDFRNLLSHGHIDIYSQHGSYFSFHRVNEDLSQRHYSLMRCLTPHLHLALVRAIAELEGSVPYMPKRPPNLTKRQREILHWLSMGKTNWEISKILGTSEDNVKYHVRRLLNLLSAGNRVDAVVKAMQLQLLDSKITNSPHLTTASISLYQCNTEK